MDAVVFLKEYAEITNAYLDQLLTESDHDFGRLWDAMRYAVQGGGKRIRPALVFLICAAFCGRQEAALPYAAALELIHTYSLIHDDLPCMDNDDLRRGRPTCHKAFGEARAVLAGDALLTLAFEVASSNPHLPPEKNARAVFLLAQAAGGRGMVGGQELDLSQEQQKSFSQLLKTHRLKTGALIACAARLGILAAEMPEDSAAAKAAGAYAENIGLAFQIVDDLMDYTESTQETGKNRSDEENQTMTFLSFMSCDEAFDYAVKLTVNAITAIHDSDSDGKLTCLARYLLFRTR